MMDWLYQELDESSSARIAEHVEGCPRCSAEASALRRTREVFRDLSPVEPPAALSAILLHEAARRRAPAAAVPAASEEGGFWARIRSWFRPIMLHPAAAAVAMLVLVAGVAGTLYIKHGDQMTDTRDLALPVTDTAVAEEPPATPGAVDAPAAPAPVTATPAERDSDRSGYTADLLGKEAQEELSREVAEQRLESAAREAAKPSAGEKKAAPRASKKASKPADARGPAANAVSGADPLVKGDLDLEGGLRAGGATRGRAADGAPKPSAPPPPSTTAATGAAQQQAPSQEARDFADPGSGDKSYRVYKDRPMSASELRASEGKLGAAVKRNDCLTAARIANDILDRNRDYYYKKVAGQTRPCQMYVNQEMKNRSARRASKNVGAGGKNVAAPQKAKSAPQADEAAAEAAAE